MPPARCSLEWFPGPLSDCSLDTAIVFDQFEITRGDVRRLWVGPERAADRLAWTPALGGSDAERAEWPAYVTYHEAEALAEARGMRLPTPREWIHVAVGRRAFVVPWGGREGPLWANTLELRLGSPCRVGTFENGRSRPFGCYDLLGNVWEWVQGVVPGYEGELDLAFLDPLRVEPQSELDDLHGSQASVMGGAFDSASRATFRRDLARFPFTLRFHAKKLDKGTLSPAVGARMCADAERYIGSMAGRWGTSEEARERVRAVGARWAEDSLAREALLALLAELGALPDPPPALAWLEEGARSVP